MANSKGLFSSKSKISVKMQCPKVVDWETMQPGQNNLEKICSQCNKSVVDADSLSEDELIDLLKKNPETCVKMDAKMF